MADDKQKALDNFVPHAAEEYADVYASLDLGELSRVCSFRQLMSPTFDEFDRDVTDFLDVEMLWYCQDHGRDWQRHSLSVSLYRLDPSSGALTALDSAAYAAAQGSGDSASRQFVAFARGVVSEASLEAAARRYCEVNELTYAGPFTLRSSSPE